jgi:hypothetical protein
MWLEKPLRDLQKEPGLKCSELLSWAKTIELVHPLFILS